MHQQADAFCEQAGTVRDLGSITYSLARRDTEADVGMRE